MHSQDNQRPIQENGLLHESFVPLLGALAVSTNQASNTILSHLVPSEQAQHADGRVTQDRPVFLLLSENYNGRVTMLSLKKKIQQILTNLGHPSSPEIAEAIVGWAIVIKRSGEDRLELLRNILSDPRKADTSHFFILPVRGVSGSIEIHGYRQGPLRDNVMQSRCQRAGSDFWKEWNQQYKGNLAFESSESKSVVLDLLTPACNAGWSELVDRVVRRYFTCITQVLFKKMWIDFEKKSRLHFVFGVAGIDTLDLRRDLAIFARRVSIYLGVRRDGVGYVLPEGKQKTIVVQDDASMERIKERFDQHTNDYALQKIGDSELGRAINEFAGFVAEAQRLLDAERSNDAGLYAVIALEYLFSEKGNTTQAVSNRAGLMGAPGMKISDWRTGRDEIKDLYNLRSQFVHSGRSVTPEKAARMIDWSREVLRALLLLHKNLPTPASFSIDLWKKKLDAIASASEAHIPVDVKVLEESGIFSNPTHQTEQTEDPTTN